jgi:hypothetical protein
VTLSVGEVSMCGKKDAYKLKGQRMEGYKVHLYSNIYVRQDEGNGSVHACHGRSTGQRDQGRVGKVKHGDH